jgi:cell division protein FtsQ
MDIAKIKKKSRKIKWTLIAGALLAALVVTGAGIAANEYLYIREINFYGNRHLSAGDLKSLLGCAEKSSFFSVSPGELYRRLKKSPWIKEALVRKDLSGRIDVHMTEAVAIGVLLLNDKSWLIDREGVRLEEIKQEQTYFLPVVRTDPDLNLDAYHEAVILAGILYDKKALAKSGNTEISGARPEDITVKVDDLIVKIGAGGFHEKLEKLNFAKNEIVKRGMKVEYVDIRFADRIVVKPHKDSQHEAVNKKQEVASEKQRGKVDSKGNGSKKRIGGKIKKHVG